MDLVMKANEVRIPEPCGVDWKSMTPAEGGRFCGECKKVVRNLSTMTEREAKRVLRTENDGQLCVRFIYDKEGKVWFGGDAPKADPLLPAGMLSRAKRVAAMASMALATQACDAIEAGINADSDEVPEGYHHLAGGAMPNDDYVANPPSFDAGADGSASETDGGAAVDAAAATDASHSDGGADGGVEIY